MTTRTPRRGPTLELAHRPYGVPICDDDSPEWRAWYAQRLLAQTAQAGAVGQWEQAEHTVTQLLAAIRRWRGGAPSLGDW